MTLAQPMLCMVRSLIRCEHLSTPASRNLCVHAWLTRMTLKTLVGLVTCIPNAQIVALLHGVQAKKTTMEAGVLHTMAGKRQTTTAAGVALATVPSQWGAQCPPCHGRAPPAADPALICISPCATAIPSPLGGASLAKCIARRGVGGGTVITN